MMAPAAPKTLATHEQTMKQFGEVRSGLLRPKARNTNATENSERQPKARSTRAITSVSLRVKTQSLFLKSSFAAIKEPMSDQKAYNTGVQQPRQTVVDVLPTAGRLRALTHVVSADVVVSGPACN